MKAIKYLPILLLLVISSCSSVRVASDFDNRTDFSQYKTYAFHKDGIDKVEISDLDKRRILRAIDDQMTAKGFTKSDNPDMLVNIFTKSSEQVNVSQFNAGYGWGYGGWGYGWGWGPSYSTVSTTTEGTLYIDLIDARKKELIWQGIGTGVLTRDRERKEERINEFVSKILMQFPPQKK
ncbi:MULTISPECIES: DUF4136 domain-containing protein [Flavobacterium]|jgi:hypothetical protein|uniref:DUF4136 domain-containing protein n=1 Tax=Flavobacterium supellecticarium TaxID=2565924 RepID=A0A4S3ZZ76_9FLAO|nr:DUF4136 domain-containing protein [Flavobacterium supellecticarium]THF51288.1 DUF4136 domain-containing protein [Flavobacterium supellecticarium]HRB70759.1 DUF4136 domain-containing protein [Flavobacterium sp.]